MMEPADHGCLDDPALIEVLHEPRLRGVLVEGEVRSGTVVVDEEVAQQVRSKSSGYSCRKPMMRPKISLRLRVVNTVEWLISCWAQ